MLSPEALLELQQIHDRETGTRLTREEASDFGMKLLRMYNVIYKPTPKDKDINKNTPICRKLET